MPNSPGTDRTSDENRRKGVRMIHPINKGQNYNSQLTTKKISPNSKTTSTASPAQKNTTAGISGEGLLYSPVKNNRQTSSTGETEGTGSDQLQDRINSIKSNPSSALLQAYTNKQSVIDLLA